MNLSLSHVGLSCFRIQLFESSAAFQGTLSQAMVAEAADVLKQRGVVPDMYFLNF